MRNLAATVITIISLGLFTFAWANVTSGSENSKEKNIVFVAGKGSHGYGAHEHYAGCKLLANWLENSGLPVKTTVHKDGWPDEPNAFDNADTIVIYSNGGGGHPILSHMDQVEELMKQGIGFVVLHYAVECPKGDKGTQFKNWLGGYFETHWSVNPHWTAKYDNLPEHPITLGVEPFTMNDEWYYHMRFVEDKKGITSILADVPPKSTLDRSDGPHSNNPHVREKIGEPHETAWAYERPDGGRSFGFTGGHWHWNWAHPDFRKVVLNAILWTAKAEVPKTGIVTKTPTLETMQANQDYSQPEDFDIEAIEQKIQRWNP